MQPPRTKIAGHLRDKLDLADLDGSGHRGCLARSRMVRDVPSVVSPSRSTGWTCADLVVIIRTTFRWRVCWAMRVGQLEDVSTRHCMATWSSSFFKASPDGVGHEGHACWTIWRRSLHDNAWPELLERVHFAKPLEEVATGVRGSWSS